MSGYKDQTLSTYNVLHAYSARLMLEPWGPVRDRARFGIGKCCYAPGLFNSYTDDILKQIEEMTGLKINERIKISFGLHSITRRKLSRNYKT